MKLVGRFALGGFAVVAVSFGVTFAILGFLNGFAGLDLLWLVFGLVVFGFLGTAVGALLGLVGLLLQRLTPRPAVPIAPAEDSTAWPPPPALPPSAATPQPAKRFYEDSAPE